MTGCLLYRRDDDIFRHPPGVDVHAEHGFADEVEVDEVAEDEAPGAEVQEPLEERRGRQHGLCEKRSPKEKEECDGK